MSSGGVRGGKCERCLSRWAIGGSVILELELVLGRESTNVLEEEDEGWYAEYDPVVLASKLVDMGGVSGPSCPFVCCCCEVELEPEFELDRHPFSPCKRSAARMDDWFIVFMFTTVENASGVRARFSW
jgi:hypothetical protein